MIKVMRPTWNCTSGTVIEMNSDWWEHHDSRLPDDVAQLFWEPENK